MLKSKRRNILTPQSEHARLSGMIAFHWGNHNFDKPELDFNAFITAVTFHDRGYEAFDCSAIPESDEKTWLAHQKRGMERNWGNPIVDLLVKFHIRRLVAARKTAERDVLVERWDRVIEEELAQNGFDRELFLWADHITQLCDNIAFDFCFEEPCARSVGVCAKRGEMGTVDVGYEIVGDGGILLRPWPLQVDEVRSFVVSYHEEAYPEVKSPVLLPFYVGRAKVLS